MIKILENGIKGKPTKKIYKERCNYCRCLFEFETADCFKQEKRLNGAMYILCPYCKREVMSFGTYYREEVIENA